ncbi:hypothetical protein HDU67_010249, partial [Dinochytrium kinnereticum]
MLATRRLALLDKENTPLKTAKPNVKTPGTTLSKAVGPVKKTPLGNAAAGKQGNAELKGKQIPIEAAKPK